MSDLIHKAALMMSNNSPLIKAATKIENISGDKLKGLIYGSAGYKTITSWIKKKQPDKTDTSPLLKTLQTICASYNVYIETHVEALAERDLTPSKLTVDDFDGDIGRYEFSTILGYQVSEWEAAQNDMDNVMLKYNMIGREHSCTPTTAQNIWEDFGGVSYVYFKSVTSQRNKPIFVRATLRVKKPISFVSNIHYVPCKMKIRVPSSNPKYNKKKPLTYVGKVTLLDKRLYFSMTEQASSEADMATFIVDQQNRWSDYYRGLYSSVSASKTLYASGLVVERKREDIDMSSPSPTLNFMNENAQVYQSVDDMDDLDNYMRGVLTDELASSPFTPFLSVDNN